MREFDWMNLLSSWAPVLLIIGFWLVFLRYMRRGGTGSQREYVARHKQHMERLEILLERIATALEKR
jgi:ATP-dependent Zn protease